MGGDFAASTFPPSLPSYATVHALEQSRFVVRRDNRAFWTLERTIEPIDRCSGLDIEEVRVKSSRWSRDCRPASLAAANVGGDFVQSPKAMGDF